MAQPTPPAFNIISVCAAPVHAGLPSTSRVALPTPNVTRVPGWHSPAPGSHTRPSNGRARRAHMYSRPVYVACLVARGGSDLIDPYQKARSLACPCSPARKFHRGASSIAPQMLTAAFTSNQSLITRPDPFLSFVWRYWPLYCSPPSQVSADHVCALRLTHHLTCTY